MNNGILTQSPQPVAMPYGLLGRPTPVPMPAVDYAFDVDAADYIRRVEAADGQALELPVRLAFDAFVRGCKLDGIRSAIKACCIMAGARTLAGALVPLVGAAPTNFNFVSGDYNRKTGLIGNGSTKYLQSNRNNNEDPQSSKHLSVYCSSPSTAHSGGRTYIGVSVTVTGASWLHGGGNTNNLSVRANTDTSLFDLPNSNALLGFIGVSRGDSASTSYRYSNASATGSASSAAPGNEIIKVFAGISGVSYSNARLAFYSIGTSLDLTLLDARVTTLMNTLAAVL